MTGLIKDNDFLKIVQDNSKRGIDGDDKGVMQFDALRQFEEYRRQTDRERSIRSIDGMPRWFEGGE